MNSGQEIVINADWRGYGWANFTLSAGGNSVELADISYLCNPLGDLVRAAVDCALGRGHARVILQQEPGAFRICVDKYQYDLDEPVESEHGSVWAYRTQRLRVYDLGRGELYPTKDAAGLILFEYESRDLDAFSSAVLAFADAIVAEHGVKGWRTLWDHDTVAFPERGVAALRAALATTDEEVEW